MLQRSGFQGPGRVGRTTYDGEIPLWPVLWRLLFLLPGTWGLSGCRHAAPFPSVSVSACVIPDSFRLEAVAAEPLLDAPVAMCFDERGRIWVAEMRGYMTDLDNSGENRPNGRISILEDTDGDGVIDRRSTFLDSLLLPRALALVYGGLLYAEPPNLWFVDIKNDRPGARVLVDSAYAAGGNVEHQPNGLLPALDNWIYSAKSDLRYRRKNNRWVREKTHFRGQWGIAQDDFGRLFYNDNSNQLQGDWLLPNALLRNRFFAPSRGFNEQICADQSVHPAQATIVNRGYEQGTLDSAGRLRNVTAACAPLIYRSGQYPASYRGNAFVCAPEANLVKRNVFLPGAPRLRARQAWPDREFLISADPCFRPVNLSEGPDGCLYIVDIHKGIIQHKTYMTAYLREQIRARGLDTIRGQGRILRVSYKGRNGVPWPRLDRADAADLVKALSHPNAWVGDKARQLLVERNDRAAVPPLQNAALDTSDVRAQIRALWALEGLDALDAALLCRVADAATHPWLTMTALHLLENFASAERAGSVLPVLEKTSARKDAAADLALCLYSGSWARFSPEKGFGFLLGLLLRHPQDSLYGEAVASGLSGQETLFINYLQKNTRVSELPFLKKILEKSAADRRNDRPAAWTEEPVPRKDGLTAGLLLYNSHCSACHGPTGQGTPHLAPPLDGSEFVHGNPDKLVFIALNGLQGPLTVKGQRYAFNAPMPGLAANPDCSDQDIAAILTYVSNAFSREPVNISAEKVKTLRNAGPADGAPPTVRELERRIGK